MTPSDRSDDVDDLEALVDHTLFDGTTLAAGRAVLVSGGRVVAVVPDDRVPARARRIALGGRVLAPGFVDLQVNGGGGALFNDDPSVDTLARIGAAHRRCGTTSWLATLISDRPEVQCRALAAVAAARAAGVPGLRGVHLEGPHLAPTRRGVHPERHLRDAGLEDIAALRLDDPGAATLVTLAPERVPDQLIAALAAAGVRVAIGHSAAPADRLRAAIAAGATGATHLFNAMGPISARAPGPAGVLLDDPRVWCGIIADGHHVDDALLRVAWKAKGTDRLFLVSDAMPPVGGGSGFSLFGDPITAVGGRCTTADGRLAGSAIALAGAVRHCVTGAGLPLPDALAMASRVPAAFLGLDAGLGRIVAGATADFVVLDDQLQVRATWIGGRPSTDAQP